MQVKTLEFLRTHDAPQGIDEWTKLCNRIAADYAIDAYRKKKRRAKYDVELCEEPDEHPLDAHRERAFDPVDEARLMEVVVAQLRAAKIPEVSFTILDGEAAGTGHVELAGELGMTRWASWISPGECTTLALRTPGRGPRCSSTSTSSKRLSARRALPISARAAGRQAPSTAAILRSLASRSSR